MVSIQRFFFRESPGNGQLSDDTEIPQYDFETREGSSLLGITPSARDFTVLDPFETWLEKQHAIIGIFIDIGQPDGEIERLTNSLFESAWNRGSVPHIFFQPFFGGPEETSDSVNQEIAEGVHDDDIRAWAEALATWLYDPDGDHRRLYVNLAPEFNGDWNPWSPALGDEDEDDFVEMWRHIHDIFSEAGMGPEFVQWIWTVDNTTRGVDRAACYPGDAYVDWCGIHGYNWAAWDGWQSAEEVYGESLDFVNSIADNPVAITEFACSSETEDGDHDPERKETWLTEAYEYIDDFPVRMSMYFNITKETDWAVFGGEYGKATEEVNEQSFEVYPAYREAVTDDAVLPPYADHPRILTDEEFAGEF